MRTGKTGSGLLKRVDGTGGESIKSNDKMVVAGVNSRGFSRPRYRLIWVAEGS